MDMVFFTGDFLSATNNIRPAQGGAAAARRQHGLKIEDKGFFKKFFVIFLIKVLCTVRCFF
jgi:hypothetical protein